MRARVGELWLEPDAEVTMGRHVEFGHALYERYAFGRLFGCTRLLFAPRKRLFYCLFAPALPLILIGRMARKALGSRVTSSARSGLSPQWSCGGRVASGSAT